MKQKIDNSSGFTLIEVLIAGLILVFGLLAMGTFLGNLTTRNASNERKTMATSIAQQKIEDLRNQAQTIDLTAADSNNLVGIAKDQYGNGTNAYTGATGETYRLMWTIDASDPLLPDELSVTVSWVATGNSQVTIDTLINNE